MSGRIVTRRTSRAKGGGVSARSGNEKRERKGQASAERIFSDNGLAIELFGAHHSNLARIEQVLDVQILARGNELTLIGLAGTVEAACDVLDGLYRRLESGLPVGMPEIDAAIRIGKARDVKGSSGEIAIYTRKRIISPRSATQEGYLKAIDEAELVFGQGPAGTGKTYLAVAKAVERLENGDVDRIIISRPAVEAGEQLGFLPGDMREKVDPYLRPIYDALFDMLPESQVTKRLESGEIEVAPLAFMRGRTLSSAFVILDEAQNTTAVQMKMFLTRLGEHSRMVITGDLSQVDLPRGVRSGLRDAIDVLGYVHGLRFINFNETDVVRHPLVTEIVGAYGKVDVKRRTGAQYELDEMIREKEKRGKIK